MLDVSHGCFRFDGSDFGLGPRVSESEFLRSSLGARAERTVYRRPDSWWSISDATLGGSAFVATVCFVDGMLARLALQMNDERFGRTWEEWSEDKERARAAAQELWLQKHVGDSRQFSWGSIGQIRDAKNCDHSIWISFKP